MRITLYLGAIVLANLTIQHFGSVATTPVAFVLIAFDLTIRDHLHTRWTGNGLVWRMGLLIAAGGLISYLLNRQAGQIAIASCVAFGVASVGDALAFHWLSGSWFRRANGSNVVGAMLDSLLFPTIAFGTILPLVVVGQFAAKVTGGVIWSMVVVRQEEMEVAM